MARRGRKRQLGVEDEYWRLMLSGMGHGAGLGPGGDREEDRVPVARGTRQPAAVAAGRG